MVDRYAEAYTNLCMKLNKKVNEFKGGKIDTLNDIMIEMLEFKEILNVEMADIRRKAHSTDRKSIPRWTLSVFDKQLIDKIKEYMALTEHKMAFIRAIKRHT